MKYISSSAVAVTPSASAVGAAIPTWLDRAVTLVRPDSWARFGCVFFLYVLASWGGNILTHSPALAEVLWPANGLLLAFLLPIPRRYWTSYLASSMVINVLVHLAFGYSMGRSVLYSADNTVEVLVAGILLAEPGGTRPDLTKFRTLWRFLLYGVVLSSITATCFLEVVLTLWAPSRHPNLLVWFTGDAMGMLLMVPLFLAITREELVRLFAPGKRMETIAILMAVFTVSIVVFTHNGLPLDFLIIPALLVATFRLRVTGGALAIILVAAPAIYLTQHSLGVFSEAPSRHDFFTLQLFLCVNIVIVYVVNAALSVRDQHYFEMREAYQQSDVLANRDHVTGLSNRMSFDRQLTREWLHAIREQGTISLLLVDVDHFKLYNDHYGHLAGDECLRRIAAVLSSTARRSTGMVARYGGEEFALILPNATGDGAMTLAERIRQAVVDAQIPHLPYTSGYVTVSVGVATLKPQPGQEKCGIVLCADRAMYTAKKAGRNRVSLWDNSLPMPVKAKK